jgi:hypothetical protein
MKPALFGALLLLSGAAVAQPAQTTQPAAAQQMQSHAGHDGQTVAPGNTAVERDARGIPVVSAPATAPAGWNQAPGTGTPAPANQPAASMGSAMDLPPCSRTVTDRCVQTYERGARR